MTTGLRVVIHCAECGNTWAREVTSVAGAKSRAKADGWQEVTTTTALETRTTWRCPEHHVTDEPEAQR